MTTKICSKCKEEKELSEYYADKQKPDGYKPACKVCCRATYVKKMRVKMPPFHTTLKGKYKSQKLAAAQRGIPWGFTFDTWHAFWQLSGKLAERGIKSAEYCMGRNGDKGPYTSWNCTIITNKQNRYDAIENGRYDYQK